VVSGDCREIVTKVGTKSGGGCSCSVDAGPAAWPGVFALLLGLAGAIGARRRARR
jgi:MYXO-CTERM domain-containing protein